MQPSGEIQAIKDILAAFFINQNTTTFNAVSDVAFIYRTNGMTTSVEKKKAYEIVATAYDNTLQSLNSRLFSTVFMDLYGTGGITFKSGVDNIAALANLVRQYIR
jgi:hypothetical protein